MAQKLNIDIVARDRSKQALNNLQGNLQKVRQSVFNLRNAFIGLGAGIVIKGFVDAGIQIENLGVQLKALFGSAKACEKALKVVTKFAATTPFELRMQKMTNYINIPHPRYFYIIIRSSFYFLLHTF